MQHNRRTRTEACSSGEYAYRIGRAQLQDGCIYLAIRDRGTRGRAIAIPDPAACLVENQVVENRGSWEPGLVEIPRRKSSRRPLAESACLPPSVGEIVS